MMYEYKKKSVHLENIIHSKLKKKAENTNTSIEKIANKYLKEKIKEEELKDEK